jgi:hypothetical protein
MDNATTMMIPSASSDCFDLQLPSYASLKAAKPVNVDFVDRYVQDVREYNLHWARLNRPQDFNTRTIKPGRYNLDEFLSINEPEGRPIEKLLVE